MLPDYKDLSRNRGAWMLLNYWPSQKHGRCYAHIPWDRLSSPDPGPDSTESKISAVLKFYIEPIYEAINVNFQWGEINPKPIFT